MSAPVTPTVHVELGSVTHSQLVVGDYATVQAAEGTHVTILEVGERRVPRKRTPPVPPAATPGFVGRAAELALIEAVGRQRGHVPVQLHAPEGTGKTRLLKAAGARAAGGAPDGAILISGRRRSLDELGTLIYGALWETSVPFLPAPAQLGTYLAQNEALVLIDDCGLDRDDLDVLLDALPGCGVVVASAQRTLWADGTAHALAGLGPDDALALLEAQLGRGLADDERAEAARLVERLGGHPQALVELAADVVAGAVSLAAPPGADLPPMRGLGAEEWAIFDVLSTLEGATLGTALIAELSGVPDAATVLADLERRGWVKQGSPRYRLLQPGERRPPDPTLPLGIPDPSAASRRQELQRRVVAHLTAWATDASAQAVAEEVEAVQVLADKGRGAAELRPGAMRLALATEAKLAAGMEWTAWKRVLLAGLASARALGERHAEARFLHQLGSRAICVGERDQAVEQLTEALRLRTELGNERGAALTRHNLDQLLRGPGEGSGPDDEPDDDGGGPGDGGPGGAAAGRRRVLAGAGGLVAVLAAVVAVAIGGDDPGSIAPLLPQVAPTETTTASAPGPTGPPPRSTPQSGPGEPAPGPTETGPERTSDPTGPTGPPPTEGPPTEPPRSTPAPGEPAPPPTIVAPR